MAGVSTVTGGFAANVSSNVLSCLWNEVVEDVKMVVSLPQAVIDMEGEDERLNSVIDGIRAELTREQRPPQRIVGTWLDKAEEAMESSRSIRNDYGQHKNCLGCFPNCLSRYRVSKNIRDWKRKVAQLHVDRQFDIPSNGEYGDFTPPTQIPIQNPESGFAANAMRSAQNKLLVTWLTDQEYCNIRRIAIHGMAGVGKTSLLDTINDNQEVRNSFELIIKVTVSKNNILDLQKCVADRLNLSLPENFEGRKDKLRSYLMNKIFLFLLDDMWAEDMWTCDKLQNLGVPLNETGFKLVLTTRDQPVCATMNVQQRIRVEPLLEDDGWELFRSRAFQNGNVPEELEEVARKIAKECKGLPLAIIVVAAAMTTHTYLYEWEVALNQLQNVDKTFYDLHPGVDTELFQRVKWSYNVLPDYLQTCFLYFAAFPEDRVISCKLLIHMWIADGLVKGSGDSYLEDIGHSYISHLRDRCLIEVVGTDLAGRISSVKMHDVLRDLAIRIAETEQYRCYFKAGQRLSDFPVDEGWARMSLMYNHLTSLPTTFACISLSVLLLSENPDIREVTGSFLSELPSLKVLDLSGTGITSLPPCIGNLKHLAFLQLEGCKGICELPETICDLNNLQFLSVTFCTKLRCLPERIGELKRLRFLDIWGCWTLSHLPRGISKLVSLESLQMHHSISLCFGDANEERKYLCLKDLQSLSRLRDFSVKMNTPVMEGFIGKWSKMRDLSLHFIQPNDYMPYYLPQDMQAMKDLERFCLYGYDQSRLPSWVREFRKLAALTLYSCKWLTELSAELQELPCLRDLVIFGCDSLEKLELGMGFPKLENLTLQYLESLECVRAVAAASGSGGLGAGASPLPMLKTLRVSGCEKLKRLHGEWDKVKCLEEISCQKEWWDAIQWEDSNIKTSLESKCKINFSLS